MMRTWMLLLFVVAGCVPPSRPIGSMSSSEIAGEVVVQRSEFEKETTYVGMTVRDGDFPYGNAWRLRGWPQASGPARHQLYVARAYNARSWVFYARAVDDAAQVHDAVKIASDVSDCQNGVCTFHEDVGVTMTDDFLRAHRSQGFRIRLSALNGDGATVIEVPANYIDGYLLAFGK